MNIMFARFGVMVAVAVVVGMMALGGAREEAAAADKVVKLDPTSGVVGTVVTAELFNAPPNDPITVIFKIPGDPVLTTGTTDANGYAKFTFTIPYVPGGGTWPIFFTDFKCSCQIAVDFTVINSRPTPVPTATPTVPAPTVPPTQPPPTQAPTNTPTATPTPGVPVLGTTSFGDGGGPNVGILALGFMAVVSVLAWFAATRGSGPRAALADAGVEWDRYSTDLDLETLEAMRRPAPSTAPSARRDTGIGWAIGAGLAAIAGVVLLRRK